MARTTWLCRFCSARNPLAKKKCLMCGRLRAKKRMRAHQTIRRDLSFDEFLKLNQEIHGVGDECAICGNVAKTRRLDRDHDHRKARARGLLCIACNKRLWPSHTEEFLRAAADYLARVDAYYAERAA